MDNLITVSIIMPAYNCDKFIELSILSVISQTFQAWELIIIDDCSTDGTFNIINDLSKFNPNIRVFQNKQNLGVSSTRNLGIKLARGEWIAFLDSDDIWKSEKLEKQLSLATFENADFIFTGSSFINEGGIPFKGKFSVPEKVGYSKLRKGNVISCSSVLLKKCLFNDVKMENDKIHEDYAVWLRILKNGVVARGLNEPLLIYRISSKSKSGNKFKSILMTYKVFRFLEEPLLSSIYFTSRHVLTASLKYFVIFYG